MNILVTGGCGFIGSHIVDAYIDSGHEVWIIDNLSTGDIKNLNPKAKFIEKNIEDSDIEEIFKDVKFDVINHHAAQINVRVSVDNPLFDAKVNILGSLNLLSFGMKYHIKRFIFASSGGTVYGEPNQLPITEEFTIDPSSPYGISKATTEKYLTLYARLYDFDCVILRYSNVYGPRQISKSEAGVISIFIECILKHNKCTVFGDGNQTRDYVYVGDVIAANIAALGCKSDIFNIGTGIETSVNDLIDMLSKIIDKDVIHGHDDARPGDVLRNALNNTKAGSVINWHPGISLEQGIRRTFEYFKEIS
ncbi:MAG: NAD-dependent epimerase/dehydratase family protein [bacterium]